ncbi:MAG: hypothetical protein AAFY24_00175 [Pseudomonadota bacterium]
MQIKKRRIRNVANYLAKVPENVEVRPIVRISNDNRKTLAKIGFGTSPKHGETILPSLRGAVSRFNAEGRWSVHRDRPKERRYIRTVRWRWKQWTGRGSYEEHEDFKDIFKDCYPRTLEDPPSTELSYFSIGGSEYIAAPAATNSEKNHAQLRHSINLLLEFFRECELVQSDFSAFLSTKTTRKNWKMLPAGAHPWPRIESHLEEILKRVSGNTQSVIIDRQKTILAHKPTELFVGLGGFSDYIAYSFPDRKIVILECVRRGNAIYVFGNNWEQFSSLSKAEIIQNKFHIDRIVHTNSWKARLTTILNLPKAA